MIRHAKEVENPAVVAAAAAVAAAAVVAVAFVVVAFASVAVAAGNQEHAGSLAVTKLASSFERQWFYWPESFPCLRNPSFAFLPIRG